MTPDVNREVITPELIPAKLAYRRERYDEQINTTCCEPRITTPEIAGQSREPSTFK